MGKLESSNPGFGWLSDEIHTYICTIHTTDYIFEGGIIIIIIIMRFRTVGKHVYYYKRIDFFRIFMYIKYMGEGRYMCIFNCTLYGVHYIHIRIRIRICIVHNNTSVHTYRYQIRTFTKSPAILAIGRDESITMYSN